MERIAIASPVFNGNEKKYLLDCIDSGWISSNGKYIEAFEESFAEFCGSRYALACANGTVTLHLILKALGITQGDEVIMPTLTYIASANSVHYCGATPVFADSEEMNFNMDVDAIEAKITKKTKAIMPVHLYGLATEMEKINEVAEKYDLLVVEDAAEAHGAEYKGKKAGTFGIAGSFSFFGNKIITSGEGGMIVTDDKELYEKMSIMRRQGMSPVKKYWHDVIGYNYRMTNMQAAVGLGQLEQIDWHLGERKRVAELYNEGLADASDYVRLQSAPKYATNVYWMNCVILSDKVQKCRDQVMQEMEDVGIEMRPLFYCMHVMPPYCDKNASFPVAEKLSNRGICLPSHAMLTEGDIEYICDTLKKIII